MLITLSLTLLILGCQATISEFSAGLTGTPVTTEDWPHSTFEPHRESVEATVGQPLNLESYHVSPNGLDRLEIFVNGEPVSGEAASEMVTSFAYKSGTAQIRVEARHGGANVVKPEFPQNTDWTVWLTWIGQVPGTYDLRLVVTDASGKTGEPVTQRIKVVE